MSGRFSAYAEYETTGVEWLGDIPRGWQLNDGKRLFSNRRESSLPEDEQLAASQQYGVVPQALMMSMNDAKVMLALKGTSSFRHVEAGDFVISLRSFEGGIEHSAYSGCVSPAYTVLAARKSIAREYYRYLLKSGPFVAALQSTTDSLRDGKSITFGQFGAIRLPIPSFAEQTQIAKFLDYETAKIDTLIEKQQQLIALLKEKRQAVISHAVTKGLNPDAPMRDSGVEWLGEVPAHWVSCSLGKVTINRCDGPFGSGLKSSHYTESGVRVVRLGNIKANRYAWGSDVFIDSDHYEQNLRDHSVLAGDVLVAGLGDANNHVGRACVAPEGIEPAMVKADCFRLRVDIQRVLPKFLALQLSTSSAHTAGVLANGSTRARIPLGSMMTRAVAYCPLDEQEQIVVHAEKLEEQYQSLEAAAAKQVELLQERRTALISAAVTGKIDVRDWEAPEAEAEVA